MRGQPSFKYVRLKLNNGKQPIKILNVDTGEIYESLTVAGRNLGYMSPLKLPEYGAEDGVEFVRKGVRLRVVVDSEWVK